MIVNAVVRSWWFVGALPVKSAYYLKNASRLVEILMTPFEDVGGVI